MKRLYFFRIILVSSCMPSLQQSCTHIKAAFSIWDKKIFCKKCKVFHTLWHSCKTASSSLFFLTLDSFILQGQWATAAADLNLQYISSNSTFSCNVNFLHFLGALLASLGELCMGVKVLYKVYDIALNTMKNTQEHERWLFTAIGNLPEI